MGKDKKTAVITGASRGIGRAIAETLAQNGYRLAMIARRRAALDELSDRLGGYAIALPIPADLTDLKNVETACSSILENFGTVDLLVNNAGSIYFEPTVSMPVERFEETIRLNLTAPWLMARLLIPAMIKAGGGTVVNIVSMSARDGFKNAAAYCASKAGLSGLTRALREEFKEKGIKFCEILPGSTLTSEAPEKYFKDNPEAEILLPEDVAHAVLTVALQGAHSAIRTIELTRPFNRKVTPLIRP
ncbi:hypothetical protein MNBD_NITROSPINAE04-1999 [hydrothermal vent metagenome]|uniref:3-oxoacyl-[acyl-carrier-protein] reductase n=1 Tax=hydrothermal vent metagenome TaxID=652676 RepID=A0A3B1BFT9_9ZZZZ